MAQVIIHEYSQTKRFIQRLGEIDVFSVPPIGAKVYFTSDGEPEVYMVTDVFFSDKQRVDVHVISAGRMEVFPY